MLMSCPPSLPRITLELPNTAAAGYTVSSACPSLDVAEFTCKALTCSRPGDSVQLDGLCTNTLKCARITYTVNGAPATTLTCPAAGSTAVVVPTIKAFGGHAACNYPGPPITVDCELCPAACLVCRCGCGGGVRALRAGLYKDVCDDE